MINGNCCRGEMRQILYFLIGFCIPFIWFGLSYAYDDPIEGQIYAGWDDFGEALSSIPNILGTIDTNDPNLHQNCTYWQVGNSAQYMGIYPGGYNDSYGTKVYENSITVCVVSGSSFYWYSVSKIPQNCSVTDSDGDGIMDNSDPTPNGTGPGDTDSDGIPDDFDLKPDSSESYKASIVSVCYDENNKVVAGVIQDGEGNQYSFGTMPTDFEGYTIDSITGDLVTYQTARRSCRLLRKIRH